MPRRSKATSTPRTLAICTSTFDHPTFRSGGRLEQAQQRTITRETDFGFVYGARRNAPEGQYYWRVTTYAMPTFTQIASQSKRWQRDLRHPARRRVALVDHRHAAAPARRAAAAGPAASSGYLTGTAIADPATLGLIPGTWRRVRNKDNDYLIDRNMQRTHNYTGLPGNRAQDQAVTESMGAIFDRAQRAPWRRRYRHHRHAPLPDADGAPTAGWHRAGADPPPAQIPDNAHGSYDRRGRFSAPVGSARAGVQK